MRPIAILAALYALVGNNALAAQASLKLTPKATPLERRMPIDSVWRRVWMLGGDSTSDTYVEPRQVVVSGNVLVVLDAGTREVRGLDVATGATKFLVKPTGQGPGEFRRPSLLTSTPTGFAILDQADSRLTAYSRAGAFLWTTPLPDIFLVNGLCVRTMTSANGAAALRITATKTRRDSSVVDFDTTGRLVSYRSIPWKDAVKNAVGFAYAHSVSIPSPSGNCVLASTFGAEWAVIPAIGQPRSFRLFEPGPAPIIDVREKVLERTLTKITVQGNQHTDTPEASRGALVHGDTAIVYASTTKRFPQRWLDYYRASTGEYLFSRKLPFTGYGLSMSADGTLFVTTLSAPTPIIMALRPATVTDAIKKR